MAQRMELLQSVDRERIALGDALDREAGSAYAGGLGERARAEAHGWAMDALEAHRGLLCEG
jgi:hypothetical protein